MRRNTAVSAVRAGGPPVCRPRSGEAGSLSARTGEDACLPAFRDFFHSLLELIPSFKINVTVGGERRVAPSPQEPWVTSPRGTHGSSSTQGSRGAAQRGDECGVGCAATRRDPLARDPWVPRRLVTHGYGCFDATRQPQTTVILILKDGIRTRNAESYLKTIPVFFRTMCRRGGDQCFGMN